MTTRNRGNYSGYSDRRSNGMNLVRQGAMLLSLGALSFFLGFFVLARVMPTGHGPGTPGGNASTPPAAPPDRSGNEAPAPRPLAAQRQIAAPVYSAPKSNLTPPSTPTSSGGPTIDAVDDSKTQAPASPDDSRSHIGSSDISGAVPGQAQTPSNPLDATVAPIHHRRRHRRHKSTEASAAAAPATEVQPPAKLDDGTQPAQQPDAPTRDSGKSQGDGGSGGDNSGGQ
jgi:hypothetical protein